VDIVVLIEHGIGYPIIFLCILYLIKYTMVLKNGENSRECP
jgi:hypothetical protein